MLKPSKLIQALLIACAFLELAACATATPNYTAKAFVNPTEEKHDGWTTAAHDIESKDAEHVELWKDGEVPAGMTLYEQGRDIEIAEAFAGQYEPIGRITIDLASARTWHKMRNMFWTWTYEEQWRRNLCWPQVALRYATFMIWRIVPTHYPCDVDLPKNREETRELLERRAKALAKAMGGNTVIVTDETYDSYTVENGYETQGGKTYRRYRTYKRLDGIEAIVVRNEMIELPTAASQSAEPDTLDEGSASAEGI